MIEDDFKRSIARLHRAPVGKLLDPGPFPFITRWLARRGDSKVVPARLFFGQAMNVVLPEIVSEQIYTYGLFDEAVSWLAIRAATRGDTVIDVGGHFGYFTLLFAAIVGNTGRVVAFEPTPSTYGLLQNNVKSSLNVVAENLAIGRVAGHAELSDYGLKYCAWNSLALLSRLGELPEEVTVSKVKVGLTTIDDYVRSHNLSPDVIKIDAENFEAEVIAGSQFILATYQPSVIMECGSEAALLAGKQLLASNYATFVSERCGDLRRWDGELAVANEKFKDLLFVPPSRMQRFLPG
jgi:FkbM family methyltransferase